MFKFQPSVIAVTLAIASLSLAVSVKADTVKARCDVYPKGSDRAKSSGPCTFSQRQGAVEIQLQNGKRYDLRPVGNQAGNYRDQNGRAAYRQSGLGDQGQIYRLANESIFVYWNAGGQTSQPAPSRPTTSSTKFANLTASSGSRINVRSQPTINSSSPHYGVSGDRVQVIRCVQDQDTAGSDLNWCNIRFVQSQATGWVRSDFIVFSDGGE
jgi:hypothetical protein